MGKKVARITEECINCAACEAICPEAAIKHDASLKGAQYVVIPEKCTFCEACIGMCPVVAIVDEPVAE